jgi:DNA-binding GntR family transcriptional regulator
MTDITLERQEEIRPAPHLKERIRNAIWRHVFTEGEVITTKQIAEEIGCKTSAARRHAIALERGGFVSCQQGEKSNSPLVIEIAPKHRHFIK